MQQLKNRVGRLERDARERLHPPLIVLVEPGETVEEATERSMQGYGLPEEAYSLRMILNFHGA